MHKYVLPLISMEKHNVLTCKVGYPRKAVIEKKKKKETMVCNFHFLFHDDRMSTFNVVHTERPVAYAAALSKAVVLLLLLIYCFIYLPLFVGVLCSSLFWYGLLYVLSRFAIILTRYLRENGCFAVVVFWMSCSCEYTVALPHGAVGESVVCDYGIS